MNWINKKKLSSKDFKCWNCGKEVASQEGYFAITKNYAGNQHKHIKGDPAIYICHYCNFPNFIDEHARRFPAPVFGDNIEFISDSSIKRLYNEARQCFSVNAFNAVVMCCRKLLMNISVSEGAKEGLSFVKYIDYLNEKGFIPPGGREWIDKIRTMGNEANHKIIQPSKDDAELILVFTNMLLKFIYEMPGKLKNAKKLS